MNHMKSFFKLATPTFLCTGLRANQTKPYDKHEYLLFIQNMVAYLVSATVWFNWNFKTVIMFKIN